LLRSSPCARCLLVFGFVAAEQQQSQLTLRNSLNVTMTMNLPSIKLFPAVIATIGCMTLLVSNGLSISGLSVFDEAILTEFGWDRGQLKLGGMITAVCSRQFQAI